MSSSKSIKTMIWPNFSHFSSEKRKVAGFLNPLHLFSMKNIGIQIFVKSMFTIFGNLTAIHFQTA
jgi:hypothetical protein